MTESEALAAFVRAGVVQTGGHFRYTSGRHGEVYVNKDALYPDTQLISRLCSGIADRFEDYEIDVVVGPALGGIILSQWVGHHLSLRTSRKVRAVFAEKQEDSLVFRRGYETYLKHKRVLVVEDILTTGASAQKAVVLSREAGGRVIGLGALCNRGSVNRESVGLPTHFRALVTLPITSWEERDCPLCHEGRPLNPRLGHPKPK